MKSNNTPLTNIMKTKLDWNEIVYIYWQYFGVVVMIDIFLKSVL
jgi:hypothetical protein